MKYFAYGSNVFLPKMKKAVLSAVPCGVARLAGYTLKFHKKSKDKSAKCDAFKTGNEKDMVHGVVYEIDEKKKQDLDFKEGLGKGYNEIEVVLESDQGTVTAFMYVADNKYIRKNLKPYTWYKQFVLEGARLNGFPAPYVKEYVEKIEASEDPDIKTDRIILRMKKEFDLENTAFLEFLQESYDAFSR